MIPFLGHVATAMSQLLGLRHAGFVKTAREIDHRPAVCMAVINTDPGYHSRPWPVPVMVMVVKSRTGRAGLGREQANVPWAVSTHTCSVSHSIATAINRLRLVFCRDC